MAIPGRDREMEGFDAFVLVLRGTWPLVVGALAAIPLGAAWMVLAPEPPLPDCAGGSTDGPLRCTSVEPTLVSRLHELGPLILIMAGAAVPGGVLSKWFLLRIGAVTSAACRRCGAMGPPTRHTACHGVATRLRGQVVQQEVARARVRLARLSVWPRPMAWFLVIFLAAVALVVAGTAAVERPAWHCEEKDGVTRCSNEAIVPPWVTWTRAPAGVVALVTATGAGWLSLYRFIHPTARPARDGMDAPPGGW